MWDGRGGSSGGVGWVDGGWGRDVGALGRVVLLLLHNDRDVTPNYFRWYQFL